MSAQIQLNEKQWQNPTGRSVKDKGDLRPIGFRWMYLEPPNECYNGHWNNYGNPKYWEAFSYEVVEHFQVSYHPFRLVGDPERPKITVWRERLKLHEWFLTNWTEIPD